MQKIIPNRNMPRHSILLVFLILMVSLTNNSIFAQSFCANDVQIFAEDFGTGTTASSHPDIISSNLTYQSTGELFAEGVYRVINNTQQKPDWHNSPDHTGNTDGKMLVVNGNGKIFYNHTVNSPSGFSPGDYTAGLYFMNVNRINLCGIRLLAPFILFIFEYQDQNNDWVPLVGSPLIAPAALISVTPNWVQLGGVFTLPPTGSFKVQNIRLTLNNGLPGGCGNDFALDDIRMAFCPSGGPLPVEFINVSAKQKGTGIVINWSTASEINNKYFDVERSIDGGSNWNIVSTTKSSGSNSTGLKNYNAYDSKPVSGYNFYRIKQVNLDGSFKYSSIVNVKVDLDKTVATVIANPFVSNLGIDFLSKTSQPISLTLFDLTGKKIVSDKWIIPSGSSRKIFDKANNIQKGIYILSILDANGLSIYNSKLVKQ